MERQIEIIKTLINDLLEKIKIEGSVEIINSNECPQFIIRTQEAGLLIGENGQVLVALNHLLRKLAESEFERNDLEKISFMIDVNDYQAKKIEELKSLAKMTALRVKYFKKEIEMKPMSAYERKIIHMALTEDPDVVTESVGKEPNRRVIVKLYQ